LVGEFGDLNIEFSGKAEELFIADVSGKIIFRLENKGQNKLFINIAEFPSGMYFIMYQYTKTYISLISVYPAFTSLSLQWFTAWNCVTL
jgi:hypothetical protein